MIRTVPETGSTNADLLDALRGDERVAEGDWLVADRQTAGRGRHGREWFDGVGNFMGSTVVRIGPGDPAPSSLALVMGLALYEAVLSVVPDPAPLKLKWPNDLVFGTAKLAGILLEMRGETVVAGVGVNLGQAPVVEGRETIALSQLTAPPDRDTFAHSLAKSLDIELERWRTYGIEPLVRRWMSCGHALGTFLTVNAPGEDPLMGTFDGLRNDGALQLRLADGTRRVIHAGDVFFARKED